MINFTFLEQLAKSNQFKETFLRNFPLLKSAEEWLNGHQHCSCMKNYVLLKLKKSKLQVVSTVTLLVLPLLKCLNISIQITDTFLPENFVSVVGKISKLPTL